jgi:fibronectin type 3 domain-containing protein
LENGQTILITVTGDYYHEVTLVVTTISVPSAPGTPTVSIGSQQLTVSWASVVGVDQYEVYYSTGDNPPASPAQTITDTPTTINDLTNGTTYYVWIKAKNDAGTSGFSPAASGTPLAPPLNIQAVPQSPERILVSWNEAAGGVSYKVYRSNTPAGDYTPLGPSSTNSYMDTSPSGGTTYYYKVSTVKGSSESELSAPVSATTRIGTSIAITLSQNDVDLSSQTVSIPRGQSRSFQVTDSYATYQWYLNGDAISGATSASYTLDTSSMKLGVYELSVIVNAGTGIPLSGNCYVRVE